MNSIEKRIDDLKGYQVPYEGTKHLCTIIEIPHTEHLPEEEAKKLLGEYVGIIECIARYEMVVIIIDPKIPYQIVKQFSLKNTHILRLSYRNSEARKNMPLFLVNPESNALAAVTFGQSQSEDDTLAFQTALELYIHHYDAKDIELDLSTLESDGQGTVIVHGSPSMKARNQDESISNLKNQLQIDNLIWSENSTGSECYVRFSEHGKTLISSKDSEIDSMENKSIPTIIINGITASYLTYYAGEKFLLLPQYGTDEDRKALELFQELFNDKEIIPVNACSLYANGYSIHSITKEVPFSPIYEIEPKEEIKSKK